MQVRYQAPRRSVAMTLTVFLLSGFFVAAALMTGSRPIAIMSAIALSASLWSLIGAIRAPVLSLTPDEMKFPGVFRKPVALPIEEVSSWELPHPTIVDAKGRKHRFTKARFEGTSTEAYLRQLRAGDGAETLSRRAAQLFVRAKDASSF